MYFIVGLWYYSRGRSPYTTVARRTRVELGPMIAAFWSVVPPGMIMLLGCMLGVIWTTPRP